MREFITGAVFRHHKRMKDTFIKSRIVRGNSAKKTGKINSAKQFLAGTLETFEIETKQIFPDAPEDANIVFANINMNSFRFKASQMTTKWVADTEFTWTCYVPGLDESGNVSEVPVSEPNLAKYKLSNISLRVNAQPTSATTIKLTLGVAPCALASLQNIADYDNNGFPMIEIITASVDIYPVY